MLEKYVIKNVKSSEPKTKQGKKPKVSRLVEGQVHLHTDTENLRKNSHKIKPDDFISVTYKTHGTSFWVSNVLVKKNLSWFEKLLVKFGVNINTLDYDLIYGSRKVVKNQSLDDAKQKDHYYEYDLWEDIKNEIGHLIPKGFSVYGECLGYTKTGKEIQKGYDYGCVGNEHKIEIYRITHTNTDGLVTELNYNEIEEFCKHTGLTASYPYFVGRAMEMYEINIDCHWNENFVKALEADFNEKDCFMCNNQVPEEGIVVRKESLFSCDAYKLKSFRFLTYESKQLDSGESDIESEN
jgi:hypothetical protein